MEATCQRCHESLRETDRFCPACGLPQLTFDPENVTLATGGEPPPFFPPGAQGVGNIAWRDAMKVSLILAIPAGLLCSALAQAGSLLALLWMGGAAAWAVSLYTKRTRTSWLSSGMGARIGLMTGLFASWFTVTLDSADMWVARHLLHQGAEMDSLWNTQMDQVLKMSEQLRIAMGISTVEAAQATQMYRAWIFSPEGKAANMVTSLATGGTFLVLFAVLGGALGARLLAQPRRP